MSRIPNALPTEDYQKPIYTPKQSTGPIRVPVDFLQPPPQEFVNTDQDWYDEPDYTQAVAQGMQETLQEARPQLSRSEAEEQMHLTELRRLAEAYSENDAKVISEVLSKNYPLIMFDALQVEFTDMKLRLDTITGAVNNDTQP